MITFGVYIQVPFCQTKCTYCNFHTGVVSRDRYEPYAAAVCREITESAVVSRRAKQFDTVYFGGGTPSLLDPTALARILDTLRDPFTSRRRKSPSKPIPKRSPPTKPSAWLEAGFNRISLGVQSFDDRELRAAGRMHRRDGYLPRGRISSRRRLSQYQHGLDRGPSAPDARILGTLRHRAAAHSSRARFDLHARSRRRQPPGQGIARGRKPLQRGRDSERRRHGRILRVRLRAPCRGGLRAL